MNGCRDGIEVALVGRERRGDENLAIRYLAAHLEARGHRVRLYAHNGPETLVPVARSVVERDPPLVGLGIPDGDAAIDALALVRALRRAGYDGHVTCGGALATLSRHALLERHPGLDSVVRLDGEVPLAEIADRIGRGDSPGQVPGVTTRAGDGPPAPVTDPAPMHTRPLRGDPPRILGVPVARLIASRGCPGRCPYCGPAALQEQAVAEGRAAGASRAGLARRGVGGTRRRDVDEIAGEMADLNHERGVRFFHFLDDNLLPPREEDALGWIASLGDALERRGVGRIALGLQVPASTATPAVVDALVDLGLVRVLLGVESFDGDTLRALGRGSTAGRNAEAISRLSRAGVATFFNCLLVHPDSGPGSIRSEIRALRSVDGALWDAFAVTVLNGSALWRRMLHEGRLDGDLLAWRFHASTPVMERVRAALLRVKHSGFGRYDASTHAYDLEVSLAIARRLGIRAGSPSVEERLARVSAGCNALKIHILDRILSLSLAEMHDDERAAAVAHLVREARTGTSLLVGRLDGIEREIEDRAGRRDRGDSLFLRSCLAAGFAFCAATALPGCWDDHDRSRADDAATETLLDAGDTLADSLPDGPVDPLVDSSPDVPPDTSVDPIIDLPYGCDDPHADFPPEGYDWWWTDVECDADRWLQKSFLGELLEYEVDACSICLPDVPGWGDCFYVVIDETGRAVDVVPEPGGVAPDPAVVDCYLEALEGHTFPCLAGTEVEFDCVVCLF